MNIANVLGASENDRFFALPLEIQDLLARMLMSRRGPQGMVLDRVVEEIDGLLEAYEKTAVLESEPAPSGAGRARAGARRALPDDLTQLLARYL